MIQTKRTSSFLLDDVPPMGIYETLYAFNDAFGQFMGTGGTHPWSQGFPLTTPLEKFNGPELPPSVEVTWEDRFYPKAWGHPLLRDSIVGYYNTYYGSNITPDNVMIFAGGRPGIYTVLSFLKKTSGPYRECRVAGVPGYPHANEHRLENSHDDAGEQLSSRQCRVFRPQRPESQNDAVSGDFQSKQSHRARALR